MGEYSARFDPHLKAGRVKQANGGRVSWTFVSILRIRNAPLSRSDESPVFGQRAGTEAVARQT